MACKNLRNDLSVQFTSIYRHVSDRHFQRLSRKIGIFSSVFKHHLILGRLQFSFWRTWSLLLEKEKNKNKESSINNILTFPLTLNHIHNKQKFKWIRVTSNGKSWGIHRRSKSCLIHAWVKPCLSMAWTIVVLLPAILVYKIFTNSLIISVNVLKIDKSNKA